ncbi:hypothetical protein PVAND_017421 [Polypedilum vanderplanki]|uniref:C2H2-type domain-containing protein n=1 Tax=Polypedilum vanderplanki TaxID=319348 RepID=A0A9J6BJF6_POLVA|nr:hypothetical protein PVAND_017421 [Polypedilum vanderplanki]
MSVNNNKVQTNCDFLLVINNKVDQVNNDLKNQKKNLSKEINCKFREKKFRSKYHLYYFCNHCELKFKYKTWLTLHLTTKHQKGKEIKFECDFDGKIFDSKAKIYGHMKTCHQTLEECNLCGKEIRNLNQHMRRVHAKENEKIKCQICHKTLKNQFCMRKHLKTHNKQHQCQLCGYKFSFNNQLKEHQKVHKNQFAFRCEKCQKNFNSSSILKRHLKTHDKNRIKKYKCSQCEYSTHRKNLLKNHLKSHNKHREKNLKCPKCDYKTDRKAHLKRHLQTHNPNREKFPCLYCNYEATRRDSLKIHIKQHDPNRI